MKQKLQFLLRSSLFVLIFLSLLWASAFVFRPKGNAPEDGIHDHKQHSFLGERENSLDVVILGDSLGQCGFSPLDIWENYGITAQVCASGNQKLFQSYDFLVEVLGHHNPKVVLLEADTIVNSATMQERFSRQIGNLFPTVRYHDRWKQLRLRDFYAPVHYTYTDDLKGYHYEGGEEPAFLEGYMEPTDRVKSVWSKNLGYLDQIHQLCLDHDIRLVFVSVPSPYCWDYARHNAVANLAEELDVPYLDLNLCWEDVGIDWTRDTYDWGNHMNYTGAQKVSVYMGQYLADTGLFTDKRGLAEYESWNEALYRFRRDGAQ